VSGHHRIVVIAREVQRRDCGGRRRLSSRLMSWPDRADLDQFQVERLNLCKDAEDGRSIPEKAGEYRLLAVDVSDHRGKGGQLSGREVAIHADAIELVRAVHESIMRGGR
jgi:hypothetical protein